LPAVSVHAKAREQLVTAGGIANQLPPVKAEQLGARVFRRRALQRQAEAAQHQVLLVHHGLMEELFRLVGVLPEFLGHDEQE